MKANTWKKDFKGVRLDRPSQKHQNMASKRATDQAMKWLRDDALPDMTENVLSVVLWHMHQKHNKGKRWILNFLKDIEPTLKELLDYYEYQTESDALWICKYKLKTDLGIDLSKENLPFKSTLKVE